MQHVAHVVAAVNTAKNVSLNTSYFHSNTGGY